MATISALSATPKMALGSTLAQVLDGILADPDLPARKQQETASALRTLAKALRKPLEMISANPVHLRQSLAEFTPAMTGMSPGRWKNIRSLLQFALSHAGLAKVPGRYGFAPSARWAALTGPLQYGHRYKLGHLARYCTAAGVEPEQVDATVMKGFLEDLQDRSLVAEPTRIHRDVIVAWNHNVTASPEWPQRLLFVPDNRSSYALPWDTFLPSLKADVDQWLDRLAGNDLSMECEFHPLRPASLRTRRRQMHLYLSALVLNGVDPTDLSVLADAVTPARAAIGLRFFWTRAGDQASVHAGHVAGLVKSVAKHWAHLDQHDLDKLKGMCRRITPRHTGMTERNRARLRPLDDPRRVQDLLTLPDVIRAEVVRAGTPTHTLALRLQTAVAIELLIMVPLRIQNLSTLQIGVHLLSGHRGEVTLAIPDHEVKNRLAVEARLPDTTVRLLNLYLSTYRPLLDGAGSSWLFPGRTADAPKLADGLREQIKTCVWRRCGLDFTPHTFRHAAGKIVLDRNPGAHGQVQRMLGHKNINTTMEYYTGMETKAALAHYDAQVTHLRGDPAGTPSRSRNRTDRA